MYDCISIYDGLFESCDATPPRVFVCPCNDELTTLTHRDIVGTPDGDHVVVVCNDGCGTFLFLLVV